MIQTALKIAIDAHKDQVDKAGVPYIFHPLTVASWTENDDDLVCALLHDVVEDSNYTFDDLAKAGIPDRIIDVLKVLTHDKATPYMEYIKKVKENPAAVSIKLLDIKHNSDLSRISNVTDKDLQRAKKYEEAFKILTGK